MKKLAKKLEENATASRCPTVADCAKRVKKNMRPTAFIHVKIYNEEFLKYIQTICNNFKANRPNITGNDGGFSKNRSV